MKIKYRNEKNLNFLIDPGFQRVNRLLSFKTKNGWTSYSQYYLPAVETKDYNIMIDGKNFYKESVRNDLRTYNNIWKIANRREMITQLVVY